LEPELLMELDRRAGRRRRSAFISTLIRRALDDEQRWDEIEAAVGSLEDTWHEWDVDPGAWVRAQRRADDRRIG
jgi:hypothetical protein